MEYAGKTAIITGASSGIGLAYAEEFAKRGANLVLVARREELLGQIAERLKKSANVIVTTVPMDLATLDAGKQLVKTLEAKKIDVDFLINNAGFGTSGRLIHENRETLAQEIVLNIATLVDLTTAYLPVLLAKNSGAIVNIASTASYQPVPGMAVYAATKAFVRSFTAAVWGEVTHSNVRVLAVSPGATETSFFDIAGTKPSSAMAPVENVVKTTFKALDGKKSKPQVIDGAMNRVTAFVAKLMPQTLVIKVAASMFLPKAK